MSIANWFNNRILVNTANWTDGVAQISDPPSVEPYVLPDILQGITYTFTFITTGTDPVELVPIGDLPPGMSISGKNITGAATLPGTYGFSLLPSNENGSGTAVPFTITVLPSQSVPVTPTITGATLQQGNAGGGSPGPIWIKLTKRVKRWPTR